MSVSCQVAETGVDWGQREVWVVHEGALQPALGSQQLCTQRGLRKTAMDMNFGHLPPNPNSTFPSWAAVWGSPAHLWIGDGHACLARLTESLENEMRWR